MADSDDRAGWRALEPGAQPQRAGRPNILFIMTDDHAAHAASKDTDFGSARATPAPLQNVLSSIMTCLLDDGSVPVS